MVYNHDANDTTNVLTAEAEDDLDAIFGALADRTRRTMLSDLASGESTVSVLARPHAMSLPAASKHIRVLERAGLVSRTVDGRVHRLALRPDRLRNAAEWIAFYRHFWEGSLDRLDALLSEFDDPQPSNGQTSEGESS